VDQIFPPLKCAVEERIDLEFNDWNYWRPKLPEVVLDMEEFGGELLDSSRTTESEEEEEEEEEEEDPEKSVEASPTANNEETFEKVSLDKETGDVVEEVEQFSSASASPVESTLDLSTANAQQQPS
jgi:Sec-independent protein translocase protein TatA